MSDPRRPSDLDHSRRIHPEGSVSTPDGATHSRNDREETIGRGTLALTGSQGKVMGRDARATLHVKGLSLGQPGREMDFGSACPRERRVFRSPRVGTDVGIASAEMLGKSHGNGRREVEGDVRSSGVPVGVVECKKHRESSTKHPGKGSSAPQRVTSDLRVGQDEFGISTAEGARER